MNYEGNGTTLIKFIVMIVFPALGLSDGLREPFTALVAGVVGFILAYLDARYPNTIISKTVEKLEAQE